MSKKLIEDLKELLEVLVDSNLKAAKHMNRGSTAERAIIYKTIKDINEQFFDVFEVIGSTEDAKSRKAQLEALEDTMKVSDMMKEVEEFVDRSSARIKQLETSIENNEQSTKDAFDGEFMFNASKKGEIPKA